MITSKTIYVTNDEKLFPTREKAVAYIENKIQEEVNEILKPLGLDSYRDLVKVVTALCGDMKQAQRLYKMLDSWLSGIDEQDEIGSEDDEI